MRTIKSERGKLIVELTSEDRRRLSALFDIIGTDTGAPTPWWGALDADGNPILNEEQFEDLFEEWGSLTDSPEAAAFFTGDR